MTRLTRLAALTLATLTLTALVAPIASAAIRIAKIRYDSPGSDTPITNAKLNGEWIRLKNTGPSAQALTGWRVRDKSGHVYVFGTFTLGAGNTVTIHTGSGSNGSRNRYWGQDNYVWNNDRDKATLKRPNGTNVDTCSYNDSSADSKTC
jgi:hypothetical protein